MKTCSACKLEKPEADFANHNRNPDGLRYECRACSLRQNKEWRARHPESNRRSLKKANLKANYGMSLDLYEAMTADQKNACKICQKQMMPPHVDHDHATGKIRGLLCRDCNFAIGLLRESIPNLQAAIAYLTPAESNIPAATG